MDDLNEALAEKAELIANVRFWYHLARAKAPSDEEIWAAWGAVLKRRGSANALLVVQELTRRAQK